MSKHAQFRLQPVGTSIGTGIGGGTANSVLFIDSSGNLAQDNTNFTFNDTTNAVTIGGNLTVSGTTTSTVNQTVDGTVTIDNSAANSFLVRLNAAGGDIFSVNTGAGAISIVINEVGADADFRIEADANANMIVLDASNFTGVGQLNIGSAAQATPNAFVVIDNPAITANSNVNFHKLLVDDSAAVTIATGTTSAIVSSLFVSEPNITLAGTGAVTSATSLYVEAAPTEATNNYALWVDAGVSRFDGNVGIGALFATSLITPDTELHVASGSAGTVAAPGSTVATFESAGNTFISILQPDVNVSGLIVGSLSDNDAGQFVYNGVSNSPASTWRLFTASVERLRYSAAAFAFQEATTISATTGAITITDTGAITPDLNDGGALGSATLSYADLFLATGGVINFANNNANITHVSGGWYSAFRMSLGTGTSSISSAATLTVRASTGLTASTTEGILTIATTDTTFLNSSGTEAAYGQIGVQATTWNGTAPGFTISDAASVYIQAPPTQGTNITLTRRFSLMVDGGITRLDGTLQLGLAGNTTGVMNFQGVTSGVVTIQAASAAGTYTMTLPTAVAAAGQQLTDAAGDGILSWAAASSKREWKNILGTVESTEALSAIVGTPVYRFKYKAGFGTGDYATEYVGVVAEEAPWAVHFNGTIINPVNTLGYAVLGIQALNQKISLLEQMLTDIQRRCKIRTQRG